MERFTFYWLTGRRTMCEGATPQDALMRAGYGGGAIRALDFYANGDNHEYDWNHETKEWERRKEL